MRLCARLNDFGVEVHEEWIARIEAGPMNPDAVLLAALAQALGVKPEVLQG